MIFTIAEICSITILSFIIHGTPMRGGPGIYYVTVPPLYIVLMYAAMFTILFSLLIAAEIEAYLWLRKGKRSKTAYLAFIAYSIGLATVIIWEINENLWQIWYALLMSSVLEFPPYFPPPKLEVNSILIFASLIFMLGLLIICVYLLIMRKLKREEAQAS